MTATMVRDTVVMVTWMLQDARAWYLYHQHTYRAHIHTLTISYPYPSIFHQISGRELDAHLFASRLPPPSPPHAPGVPVRDQPFEHT